METKGQEFEDADTKAAHMHRWCEEVSHETGERWYYLKVPQVTFDQLIKGTAARRFDGLIDWEERQRELAI
jgi:hypothetical protein